MPGTVKQARTRAKNLEDKSRHVKRERTFGIVIQSCFLWFLSTYMCPRYDIVVGEVNDMICCMHARDGC